MSEKESLLASDAVERWARDFWRVYPSSTTSVARPGDTRGSLARASAKSTRARSMLGGGVRTEELLHK